MTRSLLLAVLAACIGLFAASLLRTERRAAGRDGAPQAGPRPAPAAAERCAARTRSGASCSRPPEPGSDFCWQHG